MEADSKNINILSRGLLIEGYTADKVIDSLSKQFKVSAATAKAMLREGTVLKRSASLEMAKKLVPVFKAHGLEVRCVAARKTPAKGPVKKSPAPASRPAAGKVAPAGKVRPTAKAHAAAASSVPAIKKKVVSLSPEGRKWRARFGASLPKPKVNPIHLIQFSLAAFAGLLPALLYLLVFAIVLFQFVSVAVSTAGYMAGNAFGHIFAILFNAIFLVVVAFLLVKVVQPRPKAEGKCVIQKKDAPGLYGLLEALCELTASPFPTEVIVSNRMEIVLQPPSGFTGLRNRDSSLTIGLPMMVLQNRRQFVAVLVHELGHYSDSNKVPAYMLIHFVSRWLENRSVMPEVLNGQIQHRIQDNADSPPAEWVWEKANQLPRAYVTSLWRFSRKINHQVADWLEYCADYYTAYVLGVEHFEEFAKDKTLELATYRTVSDINAEAWKHHKLLRDIPDAVLRHYQQWSDADIQKLMQQPLLPADEYWQSPPVSSSRIGSVEKLGFEGVYKDTSSTVDLFSDLTRLSEKVTVEHYSQQYPDQEFARYIVDNGNIISMKESLGDAEIALEEFLGGAYAGRLIEFAKPVDDVQLKLDHQQTIDWIRKHLFEYRDDRKLVEELHETRQEARRILALIDVGVDVNNIGSTLERRSKTELSACLSETDKKLEHCYKRITAVDQMLSKRIMMALAGMSSQDKDLSRRYLVMVRAVGGFGVRLRTLAEACEILRSLVAQDNPDGKLLMKIDALFSECRRLIDGILSDAAPVAVFSEDDRRSLREYINASTRLDTDDLSTLSIERVLHIADETEKVVIYHYTHTLGQLAKLCHREEKRLNMRPLKLITK